MTSLQIGLKLESEVYPEFNRTHKIFYLSGVMATGAQ
jgi:hypothetical protein